jgi:hypothetical protein
MAVLFDARNETLVAITDARLRRPARGGEHHQARRYGEEGTYSA